MVSFCYRKISKNRKEKSFNTIDIEICFKWVEMEIRAVKSPCFVFSSTEDNQGVVEPIGYIGKAIETIVIVDSNGGESFSIWYNATGNFESPNDFVGLQINCPN
jgi:hypothetical protein